MSAKPIKINYLTLELENPVNIYQKPFLWICTAGVGGSSSRILKIPGMGNNGTRWSISLNLIFRRALAPKSRQDENHSHLRIQDENLNTCWREGGEKIINQVSG